MRCTAAHSTVVINDTNSAEIVSGGGIAKGPGEVVSQRREVDGSILVEASHQGYKRLFGVVHRRRYYISADGLDVRGEDTMSGGSGHNFAARFHLHPLIKALAVQDGSAVLLKLPSRKGWRFRASGGRLSLEEGVYLGQGAEARKCEQIVISGRLGGGETTIKWRLSMEG